MATRSCANCESVDMRDVDRTLRALQSLRDMGLPIDVIKIDRRFVAGLPDDSRDVAIVETLLSIAQQRQFQTLAEGVETAAQLAWLTERGCTMAPPIGHRSNPKPHKARGAPAKVA